MIFDHPHSEIRVFLNNVPEKYSAESSPVEKNGNAKKPNRADFEKILHFLKKNIESLTILKV